MFDVNKLQFLEGAQFFFNGNVACIMRNCVLYLKNLKAQVVLNITAWKMSKYGVISVLYFPVFSPNTGKYGPEITPCLDIIHAVQHESI